MYPDRLDVLEQLDRDLLHGQRVQQRRRAFERELRFR
jgi:hypothetical protein